MDHSFRSDTYKTVIIYPDLPICKILVDGIANLLVKAIIDALKPMAPELFEICMRAGKFSAQNVTFENAPSTEMWPSGKYRVWLKFFDKMDDNIANISYTASIF